MVMKESSLAEPEDAKMNGGGDENMRAAVMRIALVSLGQLDSM